LCAKKIEPVHIMKTESMKRTMVYRFGSDVNIKNI
jgi:hypothetical protein